MRVSLTRVALRGATGSTGVVQRSGVHVRRHPFGGPDVDRTGTDQLALAGVTFSATWIGFALLSIRYPGVASGARPPLSLLSLATAMLAGGASVMCLVRARLAGEVSALLAGLGLLLYGALRVGAGELILPLTTSGADDLRPMAEVVWVTTVALLLLAVTYQPGRRRPLGQAAVVAGCVGGLVIVVVALPEAGGDLVRTTTASWSARWLAGNLVAAGAWASIGTMAVVGGLRSGRSLRVWMGLTLLAFAQSRLALVLVPASEVWSIAAELFRAAAMVLAFVGTARASQLALLEQRAHLDESWLAVEASESQRRADRRRQEEMVHDLLAALSSVGGAAQLLATEGSVAIAEADRTQLAAAIETELHRVRSLLDQGREARSAPFSLPDVLMPIVVCARAEGLHIGVDVPAHLEILGSSSDTAEALQTLMDNARRHAAGSHVEVTARSAEGRVVILVEDRGPGVPEGSEARIFERGWTTDTTGEGSGLGLFVAARLIERQGGTITARRRIGGGTSFVIELSAPEAGGPTLNLEGDEVGRRAG